MGKNKDCKKCDKKEVCFLYEEERESCLMICCVCKECVCHPTDDPVFAQIDKHYLEACDDKETPALDSYGVHVFCEPCWEKLHNND